jgi:hypothetical protein
VDAVSEDLFAYLPPYARDVCEKLLPLAKEKGFDPGGLPALLCLIMLQQAMLADEPVAETA